MKILALETSSELCSVAVLLDGEVRTREVRDRLHSTSVLPMFDELLAEAQLKITDMDAIAFGRGPGMFTGLRIGTGIAQGIAFAAGLPVIPVSSLQALAAGVDAEAVLALQDARMNEIYCCAYERRQDENNRHYWYSVMDEQLLAADAIRLPSSPTSWVAAGSACNVFEEQLRQNLGDRLVRCDHEALPRASAVAQLAVPILERGDAVAPEAALPVYLRNDVAKKKGEA